MGSKYTRREQNRISSQKYRDLHRKLGLCFDCGEPATDGVCCKKHRDKKVAHKKVITQKRRDENRCTGCGTPLDPDADAGHIECINCREKYFFVEVFT